MWHELEYAEERRRERIAAAERNRQLADCATQLPISRRAARPVGRALLHLGGWLLRYGRAETSAGLGAYQPPVRSIELN